MGLKELKYLTDILEAIEHIEVFTSDIHSFHNYEKDLLIQRAVEREIGIIGEAAKQLYKINSSFELQNAHRIIATRNRIIHGYDKVDHGIIWGILKIHLPLLKNEIILLLPGK